jgi:hypothetical protein
MFRASSCPSSGAHQLQQQPLVYRRNVVVAVLLVVVGPVYNRTDHDQPNFVWTPCSRNMLQYLVNGMKCAASCNKCYLCISIAASYSLRCCCRPQRGCSLEFPMYLFKTSYNVNPLRPAYVCVFNTACVCH